MAVLPSLTEQIEAVEEALAYLKQAARFRGQEQLVADVEAQLRWLRAAAAGGAGLERKPARPDVAAALTEAQAP